jgi:RHS repeat-associated protein
MGIEAGLPNFGYAGMFTDVDSGLSLTQFRAYDPIARRWLSREPMGLGQNLYLYVNGDPLNSVDTAGLCTLQIGIAASINYPFGISFPFTAGIAIDTEGNIGVYDSGGFGVQAGAEAEGGLSLRVSNAQTVSDLSGPFNNFSAHGGLGLGGSVDYFQGPSEHGSVVGAGITFGAAAGASFSAAATGTNVVQLGNFLGR